MIKSASLVALIALRLIYQPEWKEQNSIAFGDLTPSKISTTTPPAQVTNFNGSIKDNKVMLEWIVTQNETADMFLVEKSIDGKNYQVAAYVFGTDATSTCRYQFYEKAPQGSILNGNQKLLYRIRLINKNSKTEFSSILEIQPQV